MEHSPPFDPGSRDRRDASDSAQPTQHSPSPSPISDDVVQGWLVEPPVRPETVLQNADGDIVQVSPQYTAPAPNAGVEVEEVRRYRRRYKWPIALFLLTCVSTFFVGVTWWSPLDYFGAPRLGPGIDGLMPLRRMLISHWQDGLIYMGALLAILMAHEMGHFIATLRHRIAASLPFFIPLPITPIGTLGAVIGMDGLRANRKQIFDIGLAGPLAGLLVAIPVLWVGISQLDLSQNNYGMYRLDMPLIMRWMASAAQVPGYEANPMIWQGQLNPLVMAGWVGLIVTGWNMFPVSQLDGGHVSYSLLGRRSRWIARLFMTLFIGSMIFYHNYQPILMVGLILLIGVDHPPTSDDTVRMGSFRTILGYASLLIPILCFPPRLIIVS